MTKFVKSEGCRAAFILIAILQVCFWPCFWGGKTLLTSAAEAPSILRSGADVGPRTDLRFPKLADPGAAAWQTEPWFAFARDQFRQGTIPLWDPYQAYGGPLAANMQSQPFYPLTLALFLHLTPRTYNFYILARLFIAGICAYFYLRLFLSFTAAIAGGIGSMLSGYYIIFITMPHLSVEVLIPAALLSGEHVLRRKSYPAVVWLAVVVMLVFLGGMPESALLLLTFAAVYLLFRVFSDPDLRTEWKRLVGLLATAGAVGTGLSAFLLLPFYEYMTRSSNSHGPGYRVGVLHDKLDLSALIYFFPLRFGPLFSTPAFDQDQFRNYVGLLSVFLIVIAVACVRKYDCARLNALTLFFFGSGLFIIFKKFGFIGVNWIGKLPYFSFVNFRKYEEPILAFCVWVLCAIAVERFRRGDATRLIRALALGAAGLVLVIAVILSRSAAKDIHTPRGMHQLAVGLPCMLLVLLLLTFWLRSVTRNSWLSLFIVVLITIELSLNYVVPMYRLYNRLPSVRNNPYVGGALVRFLQNKSEGGYRVFGKDWVLTPSWASVFQLFDIRDMDALYYKKYFPFLRNFIGPEEHVPTDLVSCFFGNGSYTFRMPLEKRLLQLSSVKYLATMSPFVQESSPAFKLVYDAEAKIYEYDDVLPRAAIYYDAAVERDEPTVLRKLADPSLDVFRTVVLDGSKLKHIAEIQTLHDIERVDPTTIRSYESRAVEIQASLKRKGILVLNDSDYPGWRVSIDGRPGEWFTANYLFRGVLLTPGTHTVRFEYRPASFYWGAVVSLLSCALIAGFAVTQARRDRPRRARDLQKPQQSLHPA